MLTKLFVFFIAVSSVAQATEQSPRALVHLLDYLAQDYGGAVSHGKVISASEYREQIEFAERVVETSTAISRVKTNSEIQNDILNLQAEIRDKREPSEVAALAQKIKTRVIEISGLEVAPAQLPVLNQGAQLFQKDCVSCHGLTGKGDGLAGEALDPKPANFWDPERMKDLSPFKAFNAIRIGVPGTAMAPYPTLSDKEAWELAFYIMAIRHMGAGDPNSVAGTPKISLKELATLSDAQLKEKIRGTDQAKEKTLAALRVQTGSENDQNALATARAYLETAVTLYKNGDFDGAKNRALMAYLEGVEPIEPKLNATDPSAMVKLEEQMALVRESIDTRKPLEQVEGAVVSANSQINVADNLINQAPASPYLTFTVAAAILLREGFEAVLIIIALLGVIRASGNAVAARWIHGGWVLALLAGVLAWIFSGWLIGISGAQRELMEGATSIFAVVILLYMGFWLHNKTEIGRWNDFIHVRVKAALEKRNLIGLAVISFTAVFREAFETVLFLRALWIEGGMASKTALLSGVLSSLALIFALSWVLLRYSARIPIKKLFDFSSTLMGFLAIILIGKGIHSLQETGILSVTAFPINIRFDLIGVYPTVESLAGQFFVLVASAALWMYGKKPSPKKTLRFKAAD